MSWITKSKSFLTEVNAEVRKATFPTRDELVNMTIVVLVTSVIFAVFLYISDIGISWAIERVFGVA